MRILIALAFALLPGCGHGESITSCEGGGVGAKCCLDSSGCQNFESCASPDNLGSCGGICPTPTCFADSECTPGNVCEQVCLDCVGSNACQPGCTVTGCDEGTTCNATTEHCTPTQCTTDDQCTIDFRCDGAHCVRKTCVDSTECDQFCVDGRCFSTAGVCIQPTQ